MAEHLGIKTMIADYMEKGFLENIIDMFKQDRSLCTLIGDLIKDERVRVRLGVTALVETLAVEDPDDVMGAVPGIAVLLKDKSAIIRGDAANLLGIIGRREFIPLLTEAADDENASVREIAKEAIEEINAKRGA